MGYKFLNDAGAGVIKDANNKTILRTTGASNIFVNDNNLITIQFGAKEFACMLSDIETIAGVAPSDIGDAIDKLYAVFPDAPAGDATGANPTVNVGLTAQNGSSAKFMRSDAAPAIDQAINPLWTGIHTFLANFLIKNVLPNINFQNASNDQLGFINFGNGQLNIPAFISAITSGQLRITVGTDPDGTFSIGTKGEIGLGNPVKNGTVGQVLTSGGAGNPPSWNTISSFPNSISVQGAVSASNTTSIASPTNTGAVLGEAPNYSLLALYDATQSANNRSFDLINFQGKIQFRLKNDSGSTVVTPLAFAGGQAAGITGIESNSGSGNWDHTGGLKTSKEAILSTGYTVATLPAPITGLKGARAFVTDANSATPTFMSATTGTGGGANAVPVFCNGTAWVYG